MLPYTLGQPLGDASHPSEVMLKIILSRLKQQAEKIIAEEQAGFRPGRSTTEQIFNLRILCEKYHRHQQDLYHVSHRPQEGLRRGLACSFVGNHEEVQHQCQHFQVIKNFYDKATSAVLFNSRVGDWF